MIVGKNVDFDELSMIHSKTKKVIRGVCKKLKKKDLVIVLKFGQRLLR